MLSSVLQLTKGILRDPKTRRKAMLLTIGVASLMAFSGLLLPNQWIRDHLLVCILYFMVCFWFLLTGLLLALFDILLLRKESRKLEKDLEQEYLPGENDKK